MSDDTPTYSLDSVVIAGGRNEIQSVKVDATGGDFDLEFDGETASSIAFNASAAALREALEALPQIDSGDVSVTGGPGDAGGTTPYVVEFTGGYAETDVPTLTSPADELTGGAGTVTVTVTQSGREEDPNEVKRGTGNADATERTSPLAGNSPIEAREADAASYE